MSFPDQQPQQLSHIDLMSQSEIKTALFNAVTSLLPSGAQVFSYPAQKFVTVNDEFSFYKAFTFNGLRGWLPRVIYCRGISNSRNDDGQFFASLKDHRFDYELSSVSPVEELAYAKVWLKAFHLGYIVKNYFYRSRECNYPAENTYTQAFYDENYPRHLKLETSDPLLLLSHVTPSFKSVTSLVINPESVTQPKSESVTVNIPSSESVTPTYVTLCPCGCGVTLTGRQKAATTACRKRISRAKAAA